jgi:hypothetical protein
MTYTVDLTAVLRSLFNVIVIQTPKSSEKPTLLQLKEEAIRAYESSGSRQKIRHCPEVQKDPQIPDADSFRKMFDEVKDESQFTGVTAPMPGLSSASAAVRTDEDIEPQEQRPQITTSNGSPIGTTMSAGARTPVSTRKPAPTTVATTVTTTAGTSLLSKTGAFCKDICCPCL